MTKLCEIVAVVKDRKNTGQRALTEAYKVAQKSGSFEGRLRKYQPLDDDGLELPAEHDQIQNTVGMLTSSIRAGVIALLDVTRTQDEGNRIATADVVVESGGYSFTLKSVPATHLLYLEKFFGDLLTFANSLPVLDQSITWIPGEDVGFVRSENPVIKNKTAKTPQVIVKYEATDAHPAQTELIYLDKIVGSWTETRFSGAISGIEQEKIVTRVTLLRDAVRQARERANATEIQPFKQGEDIFRFIFGD